MQRFLAQFACACLGFWCLGAVLLFGFQGFGLWGFKLDGKLMHWIGATSLGGVATLATTVFRALFRRNAEQARRNGGARLGRRNR